MLMGKIKIKKNNKRYPIDVRLNSCDFTRGSIICEEQTGFRDVKINGNLVIGAYSYIRGNSSVERDTKIGRFCSIAQDVKIGSGRRDHPLDWLSTSPFQYDMAMHSSKEVQAHKYQVATVGVTMGNDVWVGRGAVILDGVKISDGAVIAGHSVVVKDVPPYAIVGGNPAKIIKYRFSEEQIDALLELQWWDKPVQELISYPISNPNLLISNYFSAIKDLEKTNYKQFKITLRNEKSLIRKIAPFILDKI